MSRFEKLPAIEESQIERDQPENYPSLQTVINKEKLTDRPKRHASGKRDLLNAFKYSAEGVSLMCIISPRENDARTSHERMQTFHPDGSVFLENLNVSTNDILTEKSINNNGVISCKAYLNVRHENYVIREINHSPNSDLALFDFFVDNHGISHLMNYIRRSPEGVLANDSYDVSGKMMRQFELHPSEFNHKNYYSKTGRIRQELILDSNNFTWKFYDANKNKKLREKITCTPNYFLHVEYNSRSFIHERTYYIDGISIWEEYVGQNVLSKRITRYPENITHLQIFDNQKSVVQERIWRN